MNIDINIKNGVILYDDFNIDFNSPLSEQVFELQEDLLQIKYGNDYVIDVGWYPEMDTSGRFVIHVVKNSNCDSPIYIIEASVKDLKYELQNVIDLISS